MMNNNLIQDWNFANHKKSPIRPYNNNNNNNNDLVELLWRNGELVMHSQQTQTRRQQQQETLINVDQAIPLNVSSSFANSTSNLTQDDNNDDQVVSWGHHESFNKEFCSDLFSDFIPNGLVDAPHNAFRQIAYEKFVKLPSVVDSSRVNPMPPPVFPGNIGSSNGEYAAKGSLNLTPRVDAMAEMMVGSSHCGSNQLLADLDFGPACASSNGVNTFGPSAGHFNKATQRISNTFKTETLEPTLTSSSGGSGNSFNRTCKQSTDLGFHKRKSRDVEESECQSDDAAELEQSRGNKTGQRSGSARRSRAAQVHNLSERRRRDRINEKMRALQELIPHCNKADKASMLDEAIEYLKSLQFQLQVMWMGSSGMAPMMFQGMHRYMSCMAMGIGSTPLPPVNNPLQFDQAMAMAPQQNQAAMSVNYQNQKQYAANLSNQYAQYMAIHSMQQSTQPGNVFGFGSQNLQQGQITALQTDNSGMFNVEGAGAGAGATCNTHSSHKTG